jgi:hypothetical protein
MNFFRAPFAGKLQTVLLGGMILALLLIAQNQSADVYRYGLLLLIGFSLLQVVAGNIPPQTRLVSTLVRLLVGLIIVAGVFLAGILLVPYLAQLGRGG